MPYDQVLQLASVPSVPGLYAIGPYAKRVTLYSQQCRAINLVDAIHFHSEALTGKEGLKGKRVAVVGGGAAGLTAAARAAGYGADVVVLEKSAKLLGLQRHTTHRWLHPTIYDWPFSAHDPKDDQANLPVLTWSAGPADQVAEKIENAFQTIQKDPSKLLKALTSVKVTSIVPEAKGLSLQMSGGNAGSHAFFDIVLLAVGFGLEPSNRAQNSYWEGDALDNVARDKKCVLVVGYGDGGLTDLMRLCLVDFDHREAMIEMIGLLNETEHLRRIQAIELHPNAKSDQYLTKEYKRLDIPSVQNALKARLYPGRLVVLAGKGEHLFSAGACALNRVIVSQLRRIDAFKHYHFGENERIDPNDDKDFVLDKIKSEIGQEPEPILLRFGSEKVIGDIKGAAMDFAQEPDPKNLKEPHRAWENLPVDQDMTKQRLWEAPFAREQNLDKSCLVLGSTEEAVDKTCEFVKRAIERLTKDSTTIAHAATGKCLRSRESLLLSARALCLAPLAIFNLGEKMGHGDEAIMLLMGIRSAVRRGITLVVLNREISPPDWLNLPFNLRELQVIGIPEGGTSEPLERAIEEATRTLRHDESGYRDFPVFDIVRRTHRRTETVKIGEIETLCLCSFNEDHVKNLWPKLRSRLDTNPKVAQGKLSLRRVTDYSSPLLVGERLYELIRFSKHCVVDWSEWRANVFFEFGVRLAVRPEQPICIIEHKYKAIGNQPLLELFRPVEYSRDFENSSVFQDAFQMELERRTKTENETIGTVYSVVEKHIYLPQEFGGTPPVARLFDEPVSTIGRHLFLTTGEMPGLYSNNPNKISQTLDAVIEAHWIHILHLRDSLENTDLTVHEKSDLEKILTLRTLRLRSLLDLTGSSKFVFLKSRLGPPQETLPTAVTNVNEVQQAEDLKLFAKEHRLHKNFSAALKCLEQARDLLKQEMERLKVDFPNIPKARPVAAKLADCYGSMGGVYRRMNQMADAIDSYASGKRLEETRENEISSTYNRVQWIVVNILTNSSRLAETAMKGQISATMSFLCDLNSKDAWAWADILLLAVLLNDKPTAEAAFHSISNAGTIHDVYKSGLLVFEELKAKLPDNKELQWAITQYKAKLETV